MYRRGGGVVVNVPGGWRSGGDYTGGVEEWL